MKVCDNGAFALGNGDVFMACAFDDSERDGFLRHCVRFVSMQTAALQVYSPIAYY